MYQPRLSYGESRLQRTEHTYPTPTRRLMSQQARATANENPVTSGRRTVATRVRHGKIMPDGERVYFNGPPATEAELIARQEDNANSAQAKVQHLENLRRITAGLGILDMPDTWGNRQDA